MPPGCLLLVLLSACLAACGSAQTCDSSRSLSTRQFGFAKSAAQGVNESFAYLAFLVNANSAGSSLFECGGSYSGNSSLVGMQKVEAAVWAVQTFRSRFPSLLPGVTVGALVMDTCELAAVSVQLLSNLQSCEVIFGTSAAPVNPSNTMAFVGIDTMSQASLALPILNAIGKATVAYELTSSAATKSTYPLLARLSPNDLTEVEALAQTLSKMGAGHAQIVFSAASDSRYSTVAASLKSRLTAIGICVANSLEFSSSAAASVNGFATVRPVFLLLNQADLLNFASQMLSLRPKSGTFTWLLLSQHWRSIGEIVNGRENFFAGSLMLTQFATATGYSDFQSYFKALRPDSSGHSSLNPWLSGFWSQHFSCNLPGSSSTTYSKTCDYSDSTQNLQTTASFDPAAARIIQAVDLSLHSMEVTRRNLCGASSSGLCSSFRSSSAKFRTIYDNLYNAKSSLSYSDVEMSSSTGGPTTYTLLLRSFKKNYPGHGWTTVGSYVSGSLIITAIPRVYGADERNVTWATACDAACLVPCPTNGSSTTVVSSTSEEAATSTESGGNELGQLRFRRQYWVYALIVCASVGIFVCALFLVYILIILLGLPTELKTFNTLWSGQFLLLIILLGYVTLFAWVPWPTKELCGIIRFMVGFVYSAIFSILLVKLLNLMNEYLTPVYQVLLFLLAVAVQVATAVEWLVLVPSEVSSTTDGSRCSHSFIDHLQALVYCMLLILLCTVLSVRAHSIGRNNREAIFIGCTAGFSIPIWIAWTLVGGLNDSQDFKDASMAFGLFVNLTLVLLVIFIPKVHQLKRLEAEDDEDQEEDNFEDPIYVLAQGAPSVRSEGQVFLASVPASPGGPMALNGWQNGLRLTPQPRAMSVAGDQRDGLRVQRKAYSDYSFKQKTPTLAREKLGSLYSESRQPPVKSKEEQLAKLGFL